MHIVETWISDTVGSEGDSKNVKGQYGKNE